MSRSHRLAIAPVAVVAVVGTALLVGDHDGGSSGAADSTPSPTPRVVTAAEFCDGFGALAQAQQAVLTSASPGTVRDLRDAASAVADLAAGTTMPDTARAGVDYVVTAFLGLEDDATAQDLAASDDDADLRDDSHAQALAAYLGETC